MTFSCKHDFTGTTLIQDHITVPVRGIKK
ncbi:Protein CBG26909 [Caenorhabditis briggsae]|uniref:Protein CBG26909 n=1 Tax=Caenorhabditis briggsae TaxID=6238 RepID=B6IEW7_CAEBR|nr:Protein CBG26909 [Caenorhabditis briggsae]CAR98447.1 Protein CBG26909 [Caenorhabditis briggsae]